MSYSKDVLDAMRAVTQSASGLKDESVDTLVSNMVLNMQSGEIQKDLAIFNIKAGIASKLVEGTMDAYGAAVSGIESSKLQSPKLEEFEGKTIGIGYNIGKRQILNNLENYLDTYEQNYALNRAYYEKLITVSQLTGGESNPVIVQAKNALEQQRNNLLQARDLYTRNIFEARGEGVLKSKKRPMEITARLDASITAIDGLLENL